MNYLHLLFGIALYTYIGGFEQFAFIVESDIDYFITLYHIIVEYINAIFI